MLSHNSIELAISCTMEVREQPYDVNYGCIIIIWVVSRSLYTHCHALHGAYSEMKVRSISSD